MICTRCGVAAVDMGKHWRAPKSNNLKAWKLIAQGDKWWDKKVETIEDKRNAYFTWRKLKVQRKTAPDLPKRYWPKFWGRC